MTGSAKLHVDALFATLRARKLLCLGTYTTFQCSKTARLDIIEDKSLSAAMFPAESPDCRADMMSSEFPSRSKAIRLIHSAHVIANFAACASPDEGSELLNEDVQAWMKEPNLSCRLQPSMYDHQRSLHQKKSYCLLWLVDVVWRMVAPLYSSRL